MADMQIPLLKGDRISPDVQYRTHLQQNILGIVDSVFGVPGFLATHPGYDEYTQQVDGRDRGAMFNENFGEHLRVMGTRLTRINQDGTKTNLGVIDGNDTAFYQASMPYSFQSQAIISGLTMYLWDGSNLNEITDPDLGDPIDGTWINGVYFLTDGEFLYHTDIDDETSIDPIKFATSEFSPDPTLGVAKTQDNQVIVFNRYTTEFFFDAAQPNFAFQRIEGKAVKAGIVGTHLKVEMGGAWFCLGSAKDEAPTMIMLGAGQAVNFSIREVDKIISTYTEAELFSARMTTRTDDRDQLIYVHLPDRTLLYNHTMAQEMGLEYAWTELTEGAAIKLPYEFTNPIYDPLNNEWFGGDRVKNEVYRLNDLTAGRDGEENEIIVTSPFIKLENGSIDELEILATPGQTAGPVRLFLSMTYDGVTFGREWSIDYSTAKGDYNRRLIFRRLGYVRHWFGFRLRIVTQNKLTFCDAIVTYS